MSAEFRKMLGGTPSLYSLRKLDIDVEMVRDCPKSDNDADLLLKVSVVLTRTQTLTFLEKVSVTLQNFFEQI